MSIESLATVVTGLAAFFAIVISIWQTNQTRKAITQDDKFEQAETVRHFTQLYFQFVKDHKGEFEAARFKDNSFASEFWSLLSTEFYFYRQHAIPDLIFASWTVDVAEFYKEDDAVWKSHCSYLSHYEFLHPDMVEFFDTIHEFSLHSEDKKQLHNQIKDYVQRFAVDKSPETKSKDLWS